MMHETASLGMVALVWAGVLLTIAVTELPKTEWWRRHIVDDYPWDDEM